MVPKLLTLEAWVERNYGEAVSIDTVRRWVRESRIIPAPQKHGRSYFVVPEARYTDSAKFRPRLVDVLRAAETT